MTTAQDLQAEARTMLGGLAHRLLGMPVEELADLLRVLAGESAHTNAAVARERSARPSAASPSVTRTTPQTRARKTGEKRPSEELANLVTTLRDHIVKHAGLTIESIAAGLGVRTRELQLPTKKLLASGAIRREGVKRATRYFPASERTVSKAAGPAAKKSAATRGRRAKSGS